MKEVVVYSFPGLAVSEVYKSAIASSGFVIKLAKSRDVSSTLGGRQCAHLHTEWRLPNGLDTQRLGAAC